MSDETSAPAPEAPAPAAEPAPVEAQPETPQGASEFNIADLPAEAQEYIRELREEAKTRRKEHEPYKQAFREFNEAEQQYLLSLVDTLGTDQEAGAKALRDLSSQLLGIEEAAEEMKADPEIQKQAASEGMTPEQVEQLIAQKQQEARLIAQVEAETRALGFEPGTDEAQKLWDMAYTLQQPDLSKVAPLVREYLGLESPTAEEPPAPEQPPAQFPTTPVVQGDIGDNHGAPEPTPKIGSPEFRARIERRLQEASGSPG